MTPRTPARSRSDRRMRATVRAVACSGAALALGALAFSGASAALSAGAGGLIATANLWVLARIVTSLFPEERASATAGASGGPAAPTDVTRGASATWTLVVLLKMLGLFGAVWLLMRQGLVSPLPMLVGFGALPIGIAIGSVVSDRSADAGDD